MADEPAFLVTHLGNGRFRIFDGQRQRLAWVAGPRTTRWVFFEGRTYVVTHNEASATTTRGADDTLTLASPMPAKVSVIKVKVGDSVMPGDLLIMLEAMKMELPIKSPKSGRVTRVGCVEGELVQAGIPLVDIE